MALNELSEELNKEIDFNDFWDYEEEAKKERATCYSEGKKEGMQQREIEMAKELLKQNIDISVIKTTTGLSEEEIKNL